MELAEPIPHVCWLMGSLLYSLSDNGYKNTGTCLIPTRYIGYWLIYNQVTQVTSIVAVMLPAMLVLPII
jgi:hypothetical protein